MILYMLFVRINGDMMKQSTTLYQLSTGQTCWLYRAMAYLKERMCGYKHRRQIKLCYGYIKQRFPSLKNKEM